MLRSPPATSPPPLSDVSFHSPSRSPTKNHISSSDGTCSPLRPAIDERSKTTVFASIINTKLQQLRSLLQSAPSPAYVAALLACRRDEETPFDSDLAEDAARLLGKASTVGMTPLQVALMSLDAEDPTPWIARGEGNLVEVRREIIRILIEATPICDLDHVTWGNSNTVLHLASFLGEQDAVRRLLERGAKSTVRNALNFAPVDVSADEETRSIFLRYAEEEAKRKPRKFHRKPEREWKATKSPLTNERRPSYSSPRSRVDAIAKENAAESEDEVSLPSIRIVKDEQEPLDFTTNGPVTPNSKVPLASSNRVVAPLRLRTQSANPTGIQAEDILKSPPCRTTTVSLSGILSTMVRESATTGNLNVLSREDDKYVVKPPGTPTAEARGTLGCSSLVSKNPFRDPSSPSKNSLFEGAATAKAARGALEADSLVSKSPFRVRHESSNEVPRKYNLSPSSGISKSKSTVDGFAQGSIKEITGTNLPSDNAVDKFDQEKMREHESITGTDHPVDTSTRPVEERIATKPKRKEIEESLATVRDNPFVRRLNAPGADVGLVPRPQSLLEQWGTAQKLKKEVRRREPAHLMAGGGVISEKEWKEKKMKDKLNVQSTVHADPEENGAPIASSKVVDQDSIAEQKIDSGFPAAPEGQKISPVTQVESAEEQPASTVEELAITDVDQMLHTLLEGNPEDADELSSQEGGSVCIHSDDDMEITQSEHDPSDDESSVVTDDHDMEMTAEINSDTFAAKESSENLHELKEQPIPETTTKLDEPKVDVQKKFVIPKLVLCKGTTYQTRTRVVSGLFRTTAPVPSVSPNAPFVKPIPRPLPLPPSTHGRRARIPQITASVPGHDKFMFTNELEYVCTSAFATGAEGMENGRLYVRLHAMECMSKDVLGSGVIGGHGGSGLSGTSNGGGNFPAEQSFVYCTLACNGNSVCTRPVTISGGRLVIDEEFELLAPPGSILTVKLAVIPPTQGTGGIASLHSSDNLSTRSKHENHGLGKKLRMMFNSPSSQNLSGMTHGGTFNSRRGIPETANGSLDGAPLASMQIQLTCDRLSDWSSPNSAGNGLNQEWEMITKAATVVVPEEGSTGYGSRRAGKLSFRKGKKHWPKDLKQNSIGPARNVMVGTVKASVVFWPFADEKRPRNFDQCVKILLEQQEAGAYGCSPIQLKSRLSNPENLPPGIIHKILEVAFKAGCVKWSGILSMRGADTKFWRRRCLVFYPPHLIALKTPESLADPKFCVALDLRQCRGLEAPFAPTQRADELWQAATNGFRLLFPGKSVSEELTDSSNERMDVSEEDFMVEFSADSLGEAKSLVSALKGAMISLGVSF